MAPLALTKYSVSAFQGIVSLSRLILFSPLSRRIPEVCGDGLKYCYTETRQVNVCIVPLTSMRGQLLKGVMLYNGLATFHRWPPSPLYLSTLLGCYLQECL